MVERQIVALEVVGSSPTTHPIFIIYDPLAQSVEHMTFNHGVPRSNRGWITNLMGCSQAVRHKTLTLAFVGSNPATPAIFLSECGEIGRRARLRIW